MKKTAIPLLFAMTLLGATACLAQTNSPYQQVVVNNGIGLGSAIAVAISWSNNRSILWAIVHGLLSWLYIIYYYFTR